MGVYITLEASEFTMKKENKEKALAAIMVLMGKVNTLGRGGSWEGGKQTKKWFSWIDTDAVLKCKTFEEAMDEWGYPVEVDDEGNVIGISMTGEKLGQEELMLAAIAPFVNQGSYLDVDIECEHWRWGFNGKKMVEKKWHIVY